MAWYRCAAELRHADAHTGVQQERAESVRWYRRVAPHGDVLERHLRPGLECTTPVVGCNRMPCMGSAGIVSPPAHATPKRRRALDGPP